MSDTIVVFFYCKFGDETRNSFLSVARGLLSQLLSHEQSDESLLLYVEHEASRSGESVLASSKLARQLLETALKCFKTIYIVLDGIDECERAERKEISKWFRQLVGGLPTEEMDAIRCMFVSQDDGIARKDFSLLPSIRLLQRHSTDDIRAFACVWQQRIEKKLGPLNPSDRNIADLVTAKSQGKIVLLLPRVYVLMITNVSLM